ncbi:MAG: hypothetical protein ACLSAO_07850 [Anaerovoracaceae bacterium]
MAISTQGTILNIKNDVTGEGAVNIDVKIKSFPDLGAAPVAIDVTTLADDVQKFIPGVKAMAAMEFVANYDEEQFAQLTGCEDEELTYTLNFGDAKYSFTGKHNALIVGGALNVAVDMKVVALPSSEIKKMTA